MLSHTQAIPCFWKKLFHNFSDVVNVILIFKGFASTLYWSFTLPKVGLWRNWKKVSQGIELSHFEFTLLSSSYLRTLHTTVSTYGSVIQLIDGVAGGGIASHGIDMSMQVLQSRRGACNRSSGHCRGIVGLEYLHAGRLQWT